MENESEKGIERETLEPYTLRPAPPTPTGLQHSATPLPAIHRVSKPFMTAQDAVRVSMVWESKCGSLDAYEDGIG